jgi:hypothetical protein
MEAQTSNLQVEHCHFKCAFHKNTCRKGLDPTEALPVFLLLQRGVGRADHWRHVT